MAKKGKKPTVSEELDVAEPTPLATSRDNSTGLVYGKDRYGNIYRVSADEFSQGEYAPVDPDTADRVGRYRDELDKLSPLSLGYQTARGLSGRLIDVPMAELTSPEAVRKLNEQTEEKYPVGATLAEALGMVAPLAVPGLGEARLATAPGLFEAAGGLAGRGVAGLAERGALSEGARWATEGALWGASHDISRQTLEGKPLDWDKVWDATSGSALFAGVLGGGFGAVAGRFGKARNVAEKGAGDIAPTGAAEEAITAQKAVYGPEAAEIAPGKSSIMAEIGQPGKLKAELIEQAKRDPRVAELALADTAESTIQQHALKTTEGLESAMRITNDYPVYAGGKRKMTQYRAALEGVDPALAERATLEKLQSVADESRAIGESAQLADRKGLARRVADYAEARIARLEEIRGTPHYGAELAGELENMKRFMQAEASKGGGTVHSWDDFKDFMFRNGEPTHEGSIAAMLQDGKLWGERAAKMNEEINAAVHKQLYRADVVNGAFGMKLGAPDPTNPYRAAMGIDAEKVSNMLQKLDSPLKSREFQILKDYANGAEELGTTMRKYYDMTPEQSSRLAKWEKQSAELAKVLDEAQADVKIINQFRKVGIGDPHTEARIMGFSLGGALIGGTPGALAGGIAGSALGTMLNPLQKIRTAAALRRRVNAYDGWKAKAIDVLAGTKWASKEFETKAVPAILAHEESPRKLAAAARALLYGAFREPGDDNVAAMERQLEHIGAATTGKIKEGVKAWFGPAAAEYPAAVEHMAGKIQRAQQVLLEQAPTRSNPDGMGFAGWFKMPPDESELRRFEEIWTAVLQPRAVLSMAKADELSPDTVDVLDFVHPDLMADFRGTLQMSLADGSAPKSTDRRRTLSILFRVPMDPTMEPEYIDLMQSMHEMSKEIQDEQGGLNTYRDRGTGRPSGVNIEQPRGDQLEAQSSMGAEG